MDWLKEALEKLGLEASKRIDLPAESRYPQRLARRLQPNPGRWGYWLLLCRGLRCRLCGFPEKPNVKVERVVAEDVLSGLRHRVPVVVVECCGVKSRVGEWKRSRIVVEDIRCPIEIEAAGGRCLDKSCGSLEECLEACATLGP